MSDRILSLKIRIVTVSVISFMKCHDLYWTQVYRSRHELFCISSGQDGKFLAPWRVCVHCVDLACGTVVTCPQSSVLVITATKIVRKAANKKICSNVSHEGHHEYCQPNLARNCLKFRFIFQGIHLPCCQPLVDVWKYDHLKAGTQDTICSLRFSYNLVWLRP